ncbi:MAG: transcription termination/antitermination factor NusG [Runella slithyformis]|jgi:transcription termination/antitermination protein NusG|nr:MAG: transcription termination/antitermination factor NusG [Runella slithyformis]TAF97424.1 MAG: transcription termination/antitermination factor NusG [Runella sp.]TAG22209.1 MAG: transcription termination/antitermination factor NusG [Cytophagales bacterium]TAG41298.1 MAG: transcription termination/antitermination factor NusG [Cytophagia bacterium]TAF27487.1 MAG: transcription termination/antitermination factor NusG [Runella slithyformis]
MSNLNWYVLRAVSGQEKKIKVYLENEIARQHLEESIPEILIPSEKIYEMRNGKKRIREKAFFPGYIIISADLSHGEANHLITSMPGVLGFLGNTNGNSKVPVPLRQSEINRILGRVEEAIQEVETPKVNFLRGENVKIIDGPFTGFIGSVEEIFDDKKKLNVVVKIFGRNTPVELSYAQVEKES